MNERKVCKYRNILKNPWESLMRHLTTIEMLQLITTPIQKGCRMQAVILRTPYNFVLSLSLSLCKWSNRSSNFIYLWLFIQQCCMFLLHLIKGSKSSSQGYLLSTEKLHNKYAILIALNLLCSQQYHKN